MVKTLTWDQGRETARWQHVRHRRDFCEPRSPWQRPTNEQTNGLALAAQRHRPPLGWALLQAAVS